MSKYTVISDKVLSDLKNSHTLSLFVWLWSGKYSELDKTNLSTAFGMAKGTFNKAWSELVKLGYIREADGAYMVTDDPDPLFNHTAISGGLFDSDNPLLVWLNTKCPRVQRLEKPIDAKQAQQLLEDFETEQYKKVLMEVFEAMENFKDLNKKYVSANTTARNWMKTRTKDMQSPDSPTELGKTPYSPH